MKIWILSTCIPEDCQPSVVDIFTSENTAHAGFDEAMRREWKINGQQDDAGKLLPYPGDPDEAHQIMSDVGDRWGEYLLTSHEVQIPNIAINTGLLRALKDIRGELDAIHGYWTEGLDNFAQAADQAIEAAEKCLPVAPLPARVFVTHYGSRYGDNYAAYATRAAAENARADIADRDWKDCYSDDKPTDRKEMADQYFDRMSQVGEEFFAIEEVAVEGGAPASVKPEIVVTCEGGLVQDVSSNDPALVGAFYTVIDYDTEGADELGGVIQISGETADACIGGGQIEALAVTIITPEQYEAAARAAGWKHGGDNVGFWYDTKTYESWKVALSDSDSITYSNAKELCDAEDIEVAPTAA